MADNALGRIAEIVMGQSPPGETCNESSLGVPLLNGPTEFGPHHPKPMQFTTDTRKKARPGDILFCVRGSTTGRMNWADQEYAIGRGVAAIRHKKGAEYQPFLRAVIEFRLSDLLAQATGSTFPNVSFSQLANVPCPPLAAEEQRAIAHILGTLDDKIELNRRMNETLEGIARARFKSWFVDFDPVRAKAEGRDPSLPKPIAHLFPDSFEDSELGEIPRGWRVGVIGDLATLGRESVNPGVFPNEIFDHYSIPAFDEGRTPKREVGEEIKSNKFFVPPESVLLSKLNPRLPRVWMPDVQAGRRSVCSTEYLVTLPNPGVPRAFLYCLLSSDAFGREFATLVTGTSGSHQRVRPESLLQMACVLIPQPAMKHFASAGTPLLGRASAAVAESGTLAALRDSLLPKLISGEFRVKDAERFADHGVGESARAQRAGRKRSP